MEDEHEPDPPAADNQADEQEPRQLGEELLEDVAALWTELAPHTFALFFHVVPHTHPLLVKMLEQTLRTPAQLARLTRWLRPKRKKSS